MRKWLVYLIVVLFLPLNVVANPHLENGGMDATSFPDTLPFNELASHAENSVLAVPKNITDPEFQGIDCSGKIKVFIATESLNGLGKELQSIGINVSFGRTIAYSKLILPVIEVESWQVPRLITLSNALFVGKYPEIEYADPQKWKYSAAPPPISTNYTGNNTTTLLLTNGIEFGIPILRNTYALWAENTDYAGYPEVFDFASIYDYLEDKVVSEDSWFVDTSFNTTAYVKNGSVYIDYLDKTYNVTGIPSLSSTFHVGLMPKMPGRNRSAVIVTDGDNLWDYNRVYVDLNNDLSFTNEQPINRTQPIQTKDLNHDGNPDISTGLLYWISDGIHPMPHSKFVAERFGFENVVPDAGSLLCFFGDYSNGTGTQIAQSLIRTAKNTKIVPVVVRNETNIFEAWLFSAYGGDYLPMSGDEKDVCLSTILFKVNTNYWNYIDRFCTYLLSSSRVLFVLPALENPNTYSPSSVCAIYAGNYDLSTENHMLSTNAWQLATIIVGSKMQLFPSFSQCSYSWGILLESYSGTAISAAITAGVVAKLVEIVRGQGLQINPDRIREIIASATENTLLDVQSQGHGILNESEAVELMNLTSQSIKIIPTNLDFGNYQGTKYPSFCNLVYPNHTYLENITLLSQNVDRDLKLLPVILRKERSADLNFVISQNTTGFLSLNSVIEPNATVLRISITGNDGVINAGNFYIEFYIWVDKNENQIEDPGEIQLSYTGKMKNGFFAFSSAILNWSNIEGAFLKFIPFSENADLIIRVKVEWFKYISFDWLPEINVFLPSNFALPVNIDLTVPENATPGTYDGKLLLISGNINKTIPYKINVALTMDLQYEFGESVFYTDNDLLPGEESPISRWYYIDVPSDTLERWDYIVVETNFTGNARVEAYFSYPDTFAFLQRKIFGPATLINFASVGEHGLGDVGPISTIVVPVAPGLNGIKLASSSGQYISALSLRVYGIKVLGEKFVETSVWQDKFEFVGFSSVGLNLSINASGLQKSDEICLRMDENHTGEVLVSSNESGPLIITSSQDSCFSLYAVSEGETKLLSYSVDARIYIPNIKPGNYLIKVFSMRENANISWVVVHGTDVTAEVYPEGEIPPQTEFFFGAYLPTPSSPGNYSGVISLFFRENATPYLIPFSQRIIDLPPYFTELQPVNGSVLREARIYGKYKDSEGTLKTKISNVQVYINGANVTPFCVWNDTEFSLPVVLAEGNYSLLVVIADANNMSANKETQFQIDRTAPSLRVLSPENYMITREPLLFVICESETDAEVYVNEIPAETEEPGFFFCGINLIEGWNVIQVRAVDTAGNVAIERREVCLDSAPPPLAITFPETGYVTRSSFITVTGLSEYGARITVNGVSTVADSTGKFAVGITLLKEGENTVEVVATDKAGNENYLSLVAVLDKTPPEITLDPIEPFTSSCVITLSGIVRDAYLDSYVIVNSMRVQVIGQKFSVPVLLSEGVNTIKITAIDLAGNVNTRFLTITLDTTPPSINITLPNKVTLPKITINGSTEPGAKLYINNVLVYVDLQGNFSHIVNLTKGVNFITVSVSDPAGNTKTLTFAVLYVNPNELNVDDISRYNTLDKKLTELLDSLIYAVIALCVFFGAALIGLYKYMLWRFREKEKEKSLKDVFEDK